jgi:hypothetical protein
MATRLGKRRVAPDTPYLKRNGNWPMHSHHILAEFQKAGDPVKPTSPIPKDLSAHITIGDVVVEIVPQGHGRRVKACCPHCGAWVCAGHLDQHIAGCQHTWEYR